MTSFTSGVAVAFPVDCVHDRRGLRGDTASCSLFIQLDAVMRAYAGLIEESGVPVELFRVSAGSRMALTAARSAHISFTPDDLRMRFVVRSRPQRGDDRREHLSGWIAPFPRLTPIIDADVMVTRLAERRAEPPDVAGMLGTIWPTYRIHAWRDDDIRVVRVHLPEACATDTPVRQMRPVLLDVATTMVDEDGNRYLPTGFQRARFYRPLPVEVVCRSRHRFQRPDAMTVDATVAEVGGGYVVADVEGLLLTQSTGPDRWVSSEVAPSARHAAVPRTPPPDKARRVPVVSPPDGARDAEAGDSAGAAPDRETMAAVAAVWKETLNLAEVAPEDNFFRVGGDSLTAVQAISRIRRGLDVNLTFGALFDFPTLAGLAGQVQRLRDAGRQVEGRS